LGRGNNMDNLFQSGRRATIRLKDSVPACVKFEHPISHTQESIMGKVINVCDLGLLFHSEVLLPINEKVTLQIFLPSPFKLVELKAQVIWRNDEDNSHGIKLLEPKTEIDKYINRATTTKQIIAERRRYRRRKTQEKNNLSSNCVEQRQRDRRLLKRGSGKTVEYHKEEGKLDEIIKQKIVDGGPSPDKVAEFKPLSPIVSELFEFKNSKGLYIRGFHDHLQNMSIEAPFVILIPGYGETKRDNLIISYYLVKNGLNVVRYDATNHIGESDGDIINTTMSKSKTDLIEIMSFIQKRCGVDRFGVIGNSLSARVAIKAATEDSRIIFLLSIVGVVNLQYTLNAVYNEDIIGDVVKGKIKEVYDVLGFDVDKEYPITAIKDKYHDLKNTLEDVKRLDISMAFLVAEQDVWVKLDDVKLVFEKANSSKKEFIIIPDAMHQIFENPKAAKYALKQIVLSCLRYLYNKKISCDGVLGADSQEIAIQNRKEKARLRKLLDINTESEKKFWTEYMTDYMIISKVPDYKDYLTLINNHLGEIRKNEIVLDAGCGPGHFGSWLTANIINNVRNGEHKSIQQFLPINYFALDYAEKVLESAEKSHSKIISKFHREYPNLQRLINCIYILADLNYPLDFNSDYFDKICCSLVISYVEAPIFTIKELFRILKPGGRMVVTSLKPYPDLSQLYRNFLKHTKNEKEVEEARKLLSSAGKIKQKESGGYYQFFSSEELSAIMAKAGANNIKIYRSFGNQANIAVASKS